MALYKHWDNKPSDWEDKWGDRVEHHLKSITDGRLGEFEILTQYLPKDTSILEAGCGMGGLVKSLHIRGYEVEGIDNAERTINLIHKHAPGLNVRTGDVYNIDVSDDYYGGYISIGVFEHDPDGPLRGLIEANRVLSPTGYAFITVPYQNESRRGILTHTPRADSLKLSSNLSFYQYYFSTEEFSGLLNLSGLRVIDIFPYAVYAGFTRDTSIGKWLFQKQFFITKIRKLVYRFFENSPMSIRWKLAHMAMYICQPA